MTKQRNFKPEFKAHLVLEEMTGTKTMAEIYQEYRLIPAVPRCSGMEQACQVLVRLAEHESHWIR